MRWGRWKYFPGPERPTTGHRILGPERSTTEHRILRPGGKWLGSPVSLLTALWRSNHFLAFPKGHCISEVKTVTNRFYDCMICLQIRYLSGHCLVWGSRRERERDEMVKCDRRTPLSLTVKSPPYTPIWAHGSGIRCGDLFTVGTDQEGKLRPSQTLCSAHHMLPMKQLIPHAIQE